MMSEYSPTTGSPADDFHFSREDLHDPSTPTPTRINGVLQPPAPMHTSDDVMRPSPVDTASRWPGVSQAAQVFPNIQENPLVIPLEDIDSIAQGFQLADADRAKLFAFVRMGSMMDGLSVPDMFTRLYLLAVMLDLFKRRNEEDEGIGNIQGLFNDMKIRLEDTFAPTKEQEANIRAIARDVIYAPGCTSVADMHLEVLAILEKEKVPLRFTNIFGNPAREKVLLSSIKSHCASVRGHFKEAIFKSVPNTPLDVFTLEMNQKFRRFRPAAMTGEEAEIAATLEKGTTCRNALLRNFVHANPHFRNQPDVDSDGEAEKTPPTTESCTEPVRKKKKKSNPRPAKGEDFWGLFDMLMKTARTEKGSNFSSRAWKDYFKNDIMPLDKAGFKVSAMPTLLLNNGGAASASSHVPMTFESPGPTLSQGYAGFTAQNSAEVAGSAPRQTGGYLANILPRRS
ncbi:hypothetical protein EV421DRAFT_1900875 [Armillaria borealis]|uniref:Uncharacterized protein n=1 Tax=Armillaria borealis TaxID=47425 RepID=A0AA39JSQ8_9AGAR|nr:hypothetical protein EV421DRAFT_1900875 [Armillaria borealis]